MCASWIRLRWPSTWLPELDLKAGPSTSRLSVAGLRDHAHSRGMVGSHHREHTAHTWHPELDTSVDREHRAMLNALNAGKPGEARKAAELHILATRDALTGI